MASCNLLGEDKAALSTMALVATSAVGCRLIWQLSWPFNALRGTLFALVAAGLAAGIGLFPGLFMIAWPGASALAVLVVACLAGWFGFGWLTSALERFAYAFARGGRHATGFGRGVSMSMSRGRKGALSVRPSTVERTAARMVARSQASRDRRDRRAAQRSAAAAVRANARGGARSKRGFKVSKSARGVQVRLPRRR